MTVAEYLAFERASEMRHEFYDGQVFAMGGSSRNHNTICLNIAIQLGPIARDKGCQLHGMDLRTKVSPEGLYTYPDLVLVCGKAVFEDAKLDTLLNPVAIFEVLSPTSEAYDRGRKFQMYMKLESLREYVLVSQDKIAVEHFVRQDSGSWLLTVLQSEEDELRLQSCGARLKVRDIYERVEFPAEEPPDAQVERDPPKQ
jgi:Uma2 family endonuclease